MPEAAAELGVFGGSGFYSFLDDVEEVEVDTPYGPPSAPVSVGDVQGRRVAFLPRHGRHHELPAHRVNFRANVWAFEHLGVHSVIGPCAAGSLQPHVAPGDFVVCDQLVDRTWGRPDTFFDGPDVEHISFADPYDDDLRAVLVASGRALGLTVHAQGTVVVVQGPRFSTRAESRWYARQGWDVVNMTQHPEAALCRELGLRYATVALVTDYDAGVATDAEVEPVSQAQVFGFFQQNLTKVRELLFAALADVPGRR